jgi:RNA polymerase subunit RPABC4/transcription elongation factor Spt4
MFFFIGGIQPRTVRLDKQPRTCPSCGGMSLSRMRIDSYLSLFFIPLFPVKKGIPFLKCGDCGVAYREDGSTWEGDAASVQRKCRYCGRRIDSDFIYCPYCGKTQ